MGSEEGKILTTESKSEIVGSANCQTGGPGVAVSGRGDHPVRGVAQHSKVYLPADPGPQCHLLPQVAKQQDDAFAGPANHTRPFSIQLI